MFFRFSLPDQILSDQGRQFESAIVTELCSLLQIHKSRTTPYHPQGDGLVERSNRTLLNMLSIVVKGHPNTWESHLRAVCMAYNTSIQPTTGYSPFFLMLGGGQDSQSISCMVLISLRARLLLILLVIWRQLWSMLIVWFVTI